MIIRYNGCALFVHLIFFFFLGFDFVLNQHRPPFLPPFPAPDPPPAHTHLADDDGQRRQRSLGGRVGPSICLLHAQISFSNSIEHHSSHDGIKGTLVLWRLGRLPCLSLYMVPSNAPPPSPLHYTPPGSQSVSLLPQAQSRRSHVRPQAELSSFFQKQVTYMLLQSTFFSLQFPFISGSERGPRNSPGQRTALNLPAFPSLSTICFTRRPS